MSKVKVYSAFPGSGKSFLTKNNKFVQYKVKDLDSSEFNKDQFPDNYLSAIFDEIKRDEVDFLFVSTHPEVIQGLVDQGIDIYLVYPEKKVDERHSIWAENENNALKEIFMDRYTSRGSPTEFVQYMDKNFWDFVDQLDQLDNTHITKCKINRILSDLEFFVWQTNTLGYETNLIKEWDGWDGDGNSMTFYDSVLRKDFFEDELTYDQMVRDNGSEKFTVTIDSEHGFIDIYCVEADRSYSFSFGIVLQKNN
ncbi:hypothetical protein ZPAH1_orf00137 [Aeromonas phage ZPAH1]|nr:hypothetical protein ASwh1_88 [Aeromonas phage Aswh_1]QQG33899.1 hypothetical protein ZPAH1_orf00137 [Aeromonas phage ZPAH1]